MRKKESSVERIPRASRMRQIRESSGMTVAAFAEFLGIGQDAYVKAERGENNISLAVLKAFREKLGVSSDYLLFGEYSSLDKVWKDILNCTEGDKLFLMLRLIGYFIRDKGSVFPPEEDIDQIDKEIIQMLKGLQHGVEE